MEENYQFTENAKVHNIVYMHYALARKADWNDTTRNAYKSECKNGKKENIIMQKLLISAVHGPLAE